MAKKEVYEFQTAYDEKRKELAKKPQKTNRRKSSSKLKLNQEKFNEVLQLARDSKAWIIRHFRKQAPRTDMERRLITTERKRKLWQYVRAYPDVKQKIKRLSVRQHELIIREMRDREL